MIEITEIPAGLRAVDAEKNEVTIRAPDWEQGGSVREIDRRVDETISGYASSFRFPEAAICVESDQRDQWRMLANDPGSLHLNHDNHVVHIENDIKVYIYFESRADLSRDSSRNTRLSFPDRTAVTIGLRSPVCRPIGRITIPPTPEGLAAAITHLASAYETTSPDRSYPSLRSHPPLVEIGDELSVPDTIRDATPETGITLRLPKNLDSLFIAAPLAYYLQAETVVEDRDAPLLEAPEIDLCYRFSPIPDFQHDAAAELCRVFFLDCLVRNAGPYGVELAELSLLDEIGLDAKRLYDTTPQKRLEAYFDAPFGVVEPNLPDWHLSMYVQPTLDHASVLPHLLDRLSLIYLPETTPLEGGELVKQSLQDSYRSSSVQQYDSDLSDDLLSPKLKRGRVHGWIADGFPIDVFKPIDKAYENRLDYLDRSDSPISLTVVLNDPDMDGERSASTRIYQERAEKLSIELDIERELTRSELAGVFERPTDFVHYIGHCDEDGLRCADGNLSVADLTESNVQTFFLNACGSYREGLELIQKGSVAGAVTLNDVLNEQATKVGTAFARLVFHGLSIEQALRTARRRAIVNKNYAVVGDGTHRITQSDDESIARVEPQSNGKFLIEVKMISTRRQGSIYELFLSDIQSKSLVGNVSSTTIAKPKLLEHLRKAKAPIIYDGEYYWSDDLWEELSDGDITGSPEPS